MAIFLNREAIAQQLKFMKFEIWIGYGSGTGIRNYTDPDQDPTWPIFVTIEEDKLSNRYLTIKIDKILNFLWNSAESLRNRKDPETWGHLITDPPDPGSQHCF